MVPNSAVHNGGTPNRVEVTTSERSSISDPRSPIENKQKKLHTIMAMSRVESVPVSETRCGKWWHTCRCKNVAVLCRSHLYECSNWNKF